MATRKSYHAKANYAHLLNESDNPIINSDNIFEFDESDVWISNQVSSSDTIKSIATPKPSKKSSKRTGSSGEYRTPATTGSLPVNIPDWSEILRGENRERKWRGGEDEVEEEGDGMIPPHEYVARQLARSRIVSFSVHEGVGRTLKGRDLSRVRNAIWKKTGFED